MKRKFFDAIVSFDAATAVMPLLLLPQPMLSFKAMIKELQDVAEPEGYAYDNNKASIAVARSHSPHTLLVRDTEQKAVVL